MVVEQNFQAILFARVVEILIQMERLSAINVGLRWHNTFLIVLTIRATMSCNCLTKQAPNRMMKIVPRLQDRNYVNTIRNNFLS